MSPDEALQQVQDREAAQQDARNHQPQIRALISRRRNWPKRITPDSLRKPSEII
jgi:hypothetical protein